MACLMADLKSNTFGWSARYDTIFYLISIKKVSNRASHPLVLDVEPSCSPAIICGHCPLNCNLSCDSPAHIIDFFFHL